MKAGINMNFINNDHCINFSVLIANYNNSNYIGTCLDSILNQTLESFEIIIVDDCSTDDSLDVIGLYASKDTRIKVYHNKENMGCGYTKNKCASLATGTICGYIDPDDTIKNNALEIMFKYHNEVPNASIIFSSYYHCNNRMDIISRRAPKIKPGLVKTSQLDSQLINHFCTFKLNKYQLTDGIDISFKRAVDQDLYLKLEEVGEVHYIEDTLYYYRYHSNGISAYNNNFKAFFWFIKSKENTCLRRGLSIEDKISNDYFKLTQYYKNTYEYLIGSYIMKPIKLIRRLYYFLRQK